MEPQVGRELKSALVADVDWLSKELSKSYNWDKAGILDSIQPEIGTTLERNVPGVPDDVSLTDLKRLKVFARLGTGAVVFGSALLWGPFGFAASAIAGILNDQMLTNAIAQQRPKLRLAVEHCVQEGFSGLIHQVSATIASTYSEIATASREQLDKWGRSQLEVIRAANADPGSVNWKALEVQGQNLCVEMMTFLGEPQ